jgi:hypothetical protein
MVKNSRDIKGGITKPKNTKPASKHVATATTLKLKAETSKKESEEIKKGASASPRDVKYKKSSLEIDGLFGQLKGATTADATTKVRNAATLRINHEIPTSISLHPFFIFNSFIH